MVRVFHDDMFYYGSRGLTIDDGLVSQTARDRLYEVSVEIYRNGDLSAGGTPTPIVTIAGSNLE
jgi:hypothetical protein